MRQVKKDQLPRLTAKIRESFPKFAGDESYVQKIVDIVNSCVYDEHLVSSNDSPLSTCTRASV